MQTSMDVNPVQFGSRKFRRNLISFAAALLFSSALSFSGSAIIFNFSNLPGTDVTFGGGAFAFTSVGGYQFEITSVNGGVGDSDSLSGAIPPGGPFAIGTITTIGAEQTAP